MVEYTAETFKENCIHTIEQLRKGKKLVLRMGSKDIGEK